MDFQDISRHLDCPGIRAAFSLKTLGQNQSGLRERLAVRLGLRGREIVIPHQVHSNTVRTVTRGGRQDRTDGICTASQDLILSVQVADCVPLYLLDPAGGITGLIHVGWRGAARGIVKRAVEKMESLSARAERIRAVIGPSICQDHYEVGPEVAGRFPDAFSRSAGDKYKLDIPGFVAFSLVSSGLPVTGITALGLCTYSRPGQFPSYRRDGDRAGRIICMLGWERAPCL